MGETVSEPAGTGSKELERVPHNRLRTCPRNGSGMTLRGMDIPGHFRVRNMTEGGCVPVLVGKWFKHVISYEISTNSKLDLI